MSKKLLTVLIAIVAFLVLAIANKISGNDAVVAIQWALVTYIPAQAVVDSMEAYSNAKNSR